MTSPPVLGYATAYLWPAAGVPDFVRGPRGPHARTLPDISPAAASAAFHRLLFEGAAGEPYSDGMAVIEIDAGRVDWRYGDSDRAAAHFAAAASGANDPHLVDRARLNRACALADRGFPADAGGVTGVISELADLVGRADEATGVAARVAAVAVYALAGEVDACHGAIARLTGFDLPADLALVHRVNTALVLLAGHDVAAAASLLDEVLADGVDDPLTAAIVTMNRGAAAAVAAHGLASGSAKRAATVAQATRWLVEARLTFGRVHASDRLQGDCRRNLGVLRFREGWAEADLTAVETALADHWEALELYGRRPDLHREIGNQWRAIAACYGALARVTPPYAALIDLCFARAEAELALAHDPRSLAEVDLAWASLLIDHNPAAALDRALPAALYLDAHRFQLAGIEARDLWLDAETDAWDAAMGAAVAAGRGDVEAAGLLWRRLAGTRQVERSGPLPDPTDGDASLLAPPPWVAGVQDVLAPFAAVAARRYAPFPLASAEALDLFGGSS